MNSTVSRLAIRREGKGGRQTGEGLTVFRCGLPAYTTHADRKKTKTSHSNLLNHKQQNLPNRDQQRPNRGQTPQKSKSQTISDMRVHLT